jgi:hypothetical protein
LRIGRSRTVEGPFSVQGLELCLQHFMQWNRGIDL